MFLFGKKPSRPFLSVVIVAAGSASRMDGIDKQLSMLGDSPVVVHSVERFQASPAVSEIVLVCRGEQLPVYYSLIREYQLDLVSTVVAGGATRQESVFRGIRACSGDADYYAIHDGARPLITREEIETCFDAAVEHGAAAVGTPVKDTIKVAGSDGLILSTPDRSGLYAIQTPQIFSASLYRTAMERAEREAVQYTDDCQLVERTGRQVYISPGSYQNLKITTPEDIVIAQALLACQEEGIEEWPIYG